MYDYKAQFEFSFPATYGETTIEVIESDCLEAAIHLKLQRGTSGNRPSYHLAAAACLASCSNAFFLFFVR